MDQNDIFIFQIFNFSSISGKVFQGEAYKMFRIYLFVLLEYTY